MSSTTPPNRQQGRPPTPSAPNPHAPVSVVHHPADRAWRGVLDRCVSDVRGRPWPSPQAMAAVARTGASRMAEAAVDRVVPGAHSRTRAPEAQRSQLQRECIGSRLVERAAHACFGSPNGDGVLAWYPSPAGCRTPEKLAVPRDVVVRGRQTAAERCLDELPALKRSSATTSLPLSTASYWPARSVGSRTSSAGSTRARISQRSERLRAEGAAIVDDVAARDAELAHRWGCDSIAPASAASAG